MTVLFDLPPVVENVRVPESLASRCQIIAGDMLRCIPADGDVYVLK
jgi:hypothetical protein